MRDRLSSAGRSGALLASVRAAGVPATDVQVEGDGTGADPPGTPPPAAVTVVRVAANASSATTAEEAVANAAAIGAALLAQAASAAAAQQANSTGRPVVLTAPTVTLLTSTTGGGSWGPQQQQQPSPPRGLPSGSAPSATPSAPPPPRTGAPAAEGLPPPPPSPTSRGSNETSLAPGAVLFLPAPPPPWCHGLSGSTCYLLVGVGSGAGAVLLVICLAAGLLRWRAARLRRGLSSEADGTRRFSSLKITPWEVLFGTRPPTAARAGQEEGAQPPLRQEAHTPPGVAVPPCYSLKPTRAALPRAA